MSERKPDEPVRERKPDDPVHITRLTSDRKRVYIRAGYQTQRRKMTANKSEAEVFTRGRAEFLLARGRPDPRYKPRIEDV